jgi:hypothetical protein
MQEDNIIFSLKEKSQKEIINIDELLYSFEEDDDNNDSNNDFIFASIQNYDINYTVKQLSIICDYYGLLKDLKTNRAKKIDYINMIILFENDIANIEVVEKRKKLWNIMKELQSDKFMKKFILW